MRKIYLILSAMLLVCSMALADGPILHEDFTTRFVDEHPATNPDKAFISDDADDVDAWLVSPSITVTEAPTVSCTISIFPFLEDFETALSDCWKIIDANNDSKTWGRTSGLAHSGAQSMRYGYSSSGVVGNDWLFTPKFQLNPAKTYKVKFWYRRYNTADQEKLAFYIAGDQTVEAATADPANKLWLMDANIPTVYTLYEQIITGYNGDYAFAFQAYSDGYKYYLYLDDFSIEEINDYDAGVASIISPVSGTNMTDTETVKISIRNFGTQAISNVPVKYEVDGVLVGDEMYMNSIAGDGQAEYEFTAKADLSVGGIHNIKAYTILTDDEAPGNDAKTKSVTNTICTDPLTVFPFITDFESELSPCWVSIANNTENNGYFGRYNSTSFAYNSDWMWRFYGYYTVEGADPGRYHQYLITPLLAATTNPKTVRFFYRGAYDEPFRVGYSTTDNALSSFTWSDTVKATTTYKQYEWLSVPGNVKYVAIHYAPMSSTGAVYVDNITISELPDKDAALTAIISPVSGVNLSNAETVKIKVRNIGNDNLSAVSVKYEINGIVKGDDTIGIPVGSAEMEYSFNTKADLSADGAYTIKVYLTATGDSNPANDTLTIQVTNTVCETLSLPWSEGFNEAVPLNPCWTSTSTGTASKNFWQKSTGGSDPTCSPLEGTGMLFFNTWDVSADNRAWLATPAFSAVGEWEFSFYIYRNNQNTNYKDSVNVYWSSTPEITASSQLIFTTHGNRTVESAYAPAVPTNGWYKYKTLLPNIGTATGHIIIEGISNYGPNLFLDQFAITAPISDVAITAITKPAAGIYTNMTEAEEVSVKVKNIGFKATENITLGFTVNDTPAGEGSIASLAGGEEVEYSFTQTANFSVEGNYVIKAYATTTGDPEQTNDTLSVSLKNYVCSPVTNFPFTEKFDTENLNPCWRFQTSSVTAGYWGGNSYPDDAEGGSWRFMNEGECLISRELATTSTDKVFSFYYMRWFNDNLAFSVGYSTTDNETDSFVFGDTITIPEDETYRIWFNSPYSKTVPGSAKYIAIRFVGSANNRLLVDNISFDVLQGVVSSVPANNASAVAVDQNIELTFTKTITPIDLELIELKAGEVLQQIGVPSVNDKVLTISHPDWIKSTTYTLSVPVGAIAGMTSACTLTFTTVETLIVSNKTPAAGAIDVPVNAAISLTFDKAVAANGDADLSGVSVLIMDAIGGETGHSADAVNASIDAGNPNKIVIAHDDFPTYKDILVTIPAGAVTGHDEAVSWRFRTVPATISLASEAFSPANNAIGVALNAPITVTFDRNPDFNANPDFSGLSVGSESGDVFTNATFTGTTVTINHEDFAYQTLYTVTIPKEAITGLAADVTWSFTTRLPSSIEDVKAPSKVYPTITKGHITVTTVGEAKVKVVDFTGRTLAVYESSGVLPVELTYANGVYFILIENGKTVTTHKVILQK
jgi:hypothetical protein